MLLVFINIKCMHLIFAINAIYCACFTKELIINTSENKKIRFTCDILRRMVNITLHFPVRILYTTSEATSVGRSNVTD